MNRPSLTGGRADAGTRMDRAGGINEKEACCKSGKPQGFGGSEAIRSVFQSGSGLLFLEYAFPRIPDIVVPQIHLAGAWIFDFKFYPDFFIVLNASV